MNTHACAVWCLIRCTPLDTKNPLPPGVASLPAEAFKPTPLAWKGPHTGQTCNRRQGAHHAQRRRAHQVIKVWHVACCKPPCCHSVLEHAGHSWLELAAALHCL